MGLDSIQKLILRTILCQANVLRKNKRTLWLQTTPLISEFQSSTYSSAQEDLQSFINIFPLNIQQFLLDNIPSRVINGNDLRRATVGAFRANPLQQSAPNQSSDALKCMKIINDQVYWSTINYDFYIQRYSELTFTGSIDGQHKHNEFKERRARCCHSGVRQ